MTRSRFLLALLACALLGYALLSSRQAAKGTRPNLVANGSFESGLEGWSGTGYRILAAGTDAFHGTHVLEIDPGDDPELLATDVLSTTVELEPGQGYRIQVGLQASFDSSLPRMGLSLNGRSLYEAIAGMPTGGSSGGPRPRRKVWGPRSFVFFADRRENTLILGPLSRYTRGVPWGKLWLDDVRIEPLGWTRTLGTDFDLRATLPSQAAPGEELELSVVNMGHRRADQKINVAGDHYHEQPVAYTGTFELSVEGGSADLPSTLVFAHQSSLRLPVRFLSEGVQRLVLRSGDYVARSNPVRVAERPAERQAYWGDIHIHTRYGHGDWYGGDGDDNYRFARDVADLDFASLTEHFSIESRRDWMELMAPATLRWDEPGRFVALLGVESGGPSGHWNTYLRGDDPLQMFDAQYFGSRPPVAAAELRRLGASFLQIPHHFMLLDPADWRFTDRESQTLAEIYSVHGLSEEAGQWWRHPLASGLRYEDSMGARGHDYRTALARGHRLGVIACSDEHTGRPGLAGLTCVLTPALEREALWDSLRARHCYATSGPRVLLDFEIEGAPQGSEIVVEPGRELSARIEAHGTSPIERVELLRAGEVVKTLEPRALDLEERVDLGPHDGRPTYYQTRLFQGDLHRAWSSPIWIDPTGIPDLALAHPDLWYDFERSTLAVTPRNHGSAAAPAELRLHSSARDTRLGEIDVAALDRSAFLLRLEPIDDGEVRIKALLFTPKNLGRTFVYSGRIGFEGADGYEIVTDPRAMLRAHGDALTWEDEFGMNFRLSQSRSGQVSDLELRVRVRPETRIEVTALVDGTAPQLWLGNQRATGPTLLLDGLADLARRTLIARRTVELAPGGTARLEFDKLKPDVTYVGVLDPGGKVQETFEDNNAWACTPRAESRRPHWPEYQTEK